MSNCPGNLESVPTNTLNLETNKGSFSSGCHLSNMRLLYNQRAVRTVSFPNVKLGWEVNVAGLVSDRQHVICGCPWCAGTEWLERRGVWSRYDDIPFVVAWIVWFLVFGGFGQECAQTQSEPPDLFKRKNGYIYENNNKNDLLFYVWLKHFWLGFWIASLVSDLCAVLDSLFWVICSQKLQFCSGRNVLVRCGAVLCSWRSDMQLQYVPGLFYCHVGRTFATLANDFLSVFSHFSANNIRVRSPFCIRFTKLWSFVYCKLFNKSVNRILMFILSILFYLRSSTAVSFVPMETC